MLERRSPYTTSEDSVSSDIRICDLKNIVNRYMLDFVKQNRVRLETGLSVKDLIHEGHEVAPRDGVNI